jgi:hypothetical protein
MSPSSHSAPLTKIIDVESHGKTLERHSSCITSALRIFLGSLENERAWWFAIVPGDLDDATMYRSRGISEILWLVCLRAMKCITFTKSKGTDEPEQLSLDERVLQYNAPRTRGGFSNSCFEPSSDRAI